MESVQKTRQNIGPSDKIWLIASSLIGLVLFFYACLQYAPVAIGFRMDVNSILELGIFESNYLYALLHVFVFLPVFILSFDKKVAFYKTWPALFPSIFISGLIFILWDTYFTHLGLWDFNTPYITSISFLGLPIEELLFFFTVPYACVFIYECLNAYFPKAHNFINASKLSLILGIGTLVVGLFNFGNIYTGITFSLLGIALLLVYFLKYRHASKFYFMYVVSVLPFLMVNGVLTGSCTKEPVVIYNPTEILGIRIVTIPIEDFFYNMLYLLFVIVLLEYFRSEKAK